MKREIQVRVEYTDGYKERFTSACIEAIRRRESYEGTATKIDVYMPQNMNSRKKPTSDEEEDQVFDFGDEDKKEDQTYDFGDKDDGKTPPPTTQNIFNPLIIQQSGANSTVIPNYGTINLDLNNRNDRTDRTDRDHGPGSI